MPSTIPIAGCEEPKVPGAKIVASIQRDISGEDSRLEADGTNWADQWGEAPWGDWGDTWAQMASL